MEDKAEDFKSARFAEHECGLRYARCDLDPDWWIGTDGDYENTTYLVEAGAVPVPTKPHISRDEFLRIADDIINNLSRTTDPHEYIEDRLKSAGIEVPEGPVTKIDRLLDEWSSTKLKFQTFGEYATANGVKAGN